MKPGFLRPGLRRLVFALALAGALAGSCAWPQHPNAPPSVKGTPDLSGGPENGQREIGPGNVASTNLRVIYSGSSRVRWVALTFDDGPDDRFTPWVLNVLRSQGVKGTFFLTGQRSEVHPDLVRRIVAEGHEIGNHSYNHAKLVNLPPWRVRDQLARTHQILRRLTLRPVRFFRAPYGAVNHQLLLDAQALGYRTVQWSVDSEDWKSLPKDQVLSNILPNVRPGSIILQHSAGGVGEDLSGTAQALPALVRTLRLRGYRFVTLSEMLGPK